MNQPEAKESEVSRASAGYSPLADEILETIRRAKTVQEVNDVAMKNAEAFRELKKGPPLLAVRAKHIEELAALRRHEIRKGQHVQR